MTRADSVLAGVTAVLAGETVTHTQLAAALETGRPTGRAVAQVTFAGLDSVKTNLLDAFGGIKAGVAYVLHKALEPMMIGACYAFYTKGQARNGARWIRDTFLLSMVFSLASLVGAAAGYFVKVETTYFFALGTGTSIYAAMRLLAPLFTPGQTIKSNYSISIAVALLLGFIAIYIAALFHSG